MCCKDLIPRSSDDRPPPLLKARSPSGKHIVEAHGSLAILALIARDVVRWIGLVGVSYAGGAQVVNELISGLL